MEGVVQSRRNHETVYLDCEPCHELCNHAPEAASQAKRRWNPKHQWHTPFHLPFPTLKIAYRACLSVRLQKNKSVAPLENLCAINKQSLLQKNLCNTNKQICAPKKPWSITNNIFCKNLCTYESFMVQWSVHYTKKKNKTICAPRIRALLTNTNVLQRISVLQKLSCVNEFGVAEALCLLQASGGAFLCWTRTHQRTIHWMPTIITQLWMSLNWVTIWFHLGNQFCKK